MFEVRHGARRRLRFGAEAGAFEVGDEFEAKQRLCTQEDESLYTEPVLAEAAELPLSEVTFRRPIPGQQFITLDSIVQGSHVVFKELPATFDGELGNGIGDVIALKRSLTGGEVVIVTESLPTCSVNEGFSIVVAPP